MSDTIGLLLGVVGLSLFVLYLGYMLGLADGIKEERDREKGEQ